MSDTLTRRQVLQRALAGGIGGLVALYTATRTQAAVQVTPIEDEVLVAAQATPTAPALATQMSNAAQQFLTSLGSAARTRATYAFANAERQRWHWTTPAGFPRNGLPLRAMTAQQRTRALALLRTGTSAVGYQKALNIMALQRELQSDPELYYVTIFGTPGGREPWGWRWEGHHLSRHFTIVGNQVIMTPFFLGAWPTTTASGQRTMPREEDAARELIRSLTGARRTQAIIQERSLTNHVTGNQARVTPLPPVGIAASQLTAAQQRLMLEIVETYLGVLPVSIATPQLARIRQAGLGSIRFGWAGSLEPRQPHYYRLQGPTFLLEFDNSRNGGTHIHSVWRDFAEDFGQHLL